MSKRSPKGQKIKVTVWTVASDYVLGHPHHNPTGLHFESGPTYVYAHTRQIDWSAMHARLAHAQPATHRAQEG